MFDAVTEDQFASKTPDYDPLWDLLSDLICDALRDLVPFVQF